MSVGDGQIFQQAAESRRAILDEGFTECGGGKSMAEFLSDLYLVTRLIS
jgi:hypothetical protein